MICQINDSSVWHNLHITVFVYYSLADIKMPIIFSDPVDL